MHNCISFFRGSSMILLTRVLNSPLRLSTETRHHVYRALRPVPPKEFYERSPIREMHCFGGTTTEKAALATDHSVPRCRAQATVRAGQTPPRLSTPFHRLRQPTAVQF